jgi:hypothetical protein
LRYLLVFAAESATVSRVPSIAVSSRPRQRTWVALVTAGPGVSDGLCN